MTPEETLSDGEIAKIVNELRDIAVQYHGTQQLRERIARVVVPRLKVARTMLMREPQVAFPAPEGAYLASLKIRACENEPAACWELQKFSTNYARTVLEQCSIRAMTWCMENGMNANVATELDITIRALAKEKS